MLYVVAVMASPCQLSVAVETSAGWKEATFPNAEQGAMQLVRFVEEVVGRPSDGVRVVVGALDDAGSDRHIVGLLRSAGVPYGLAMPKDVRAAAAAQALPEGCPMAVAFADLGRFGFLYRREFGATPLQ